VLVALQAWAALPPSDRSGLPGDGVALLPWLLLGWGPVAVVASAILAGSPSRARIGIAWSLFPIAALAEPLTRAVDKEGAVAVVVVACSLAGLGVVLGRWAPLPASLAALGAGIARIPPAEPLSPSVRAAEDGPPLVLLTLDTFRADHLGVLGGPVPTPHLDALAARGLLFAEGVAPAPVTGPAHAGLLTGRPPHALGVLRNGDPLPAEVPTVAEALRAAGWATGAFLAAGVLDRRVGLGRGFDHYDDRLSAFHRVAEQPPWPLLRGLGVDLPRTSQRPGAEVVERALTWYAAQERPVFLWVHLYDAHSPRPSAEGPALLPPGLRDVDWEAWSEAHFGYRTPRGPSRGEGQLAGYAEEVRAVDALVGELVAGLPPATRWVVAADHGESLIEHGDRLNHGRHVFQSVIRVPLVVVGPGITPALVRDPVPSWLVGPTLLRMAGQPAEDHLLRRASEPWRDPILSYTTGQEARPRFGLPRPGAELGWREGDAKVVVAADRRWRFDLATDPHEARPEPVEHPDASAELARIGGLRPTERTAADRAWLEALGYVD
jgi:arylsulfatase A-like enzyme